MEFSRQEYWGGLPFPLQWIFPTQGSTSGLLHCRQILYLLSHQGDIQPTPVCNQFLWEKLQLHPFSLTEMFLDSNFVQWEVENFRRLSPKLARSCSKSWGMENSDQELFTSKASLINPSQEKEGIDLSTSVSLKQLSPLPLDFLTWLSLLSTASRFTRDFSTVHQNLSNQNMLVTME